MKIKTPLYMQISLGLLGLCHIPIFWMLRFADALDMLTFYVFMCLLTFGICEVAIRLDERLETKKQKADRRVYVTWKQ